MSQRRQASKYNSKAWGKPLNVGDKVWLFNPRTPRGLSPKLTKHWTGPFIIRRQTSEVDYLIKEEKGRKSFVVHQNRLNLCTAPAENSSDVTCSSADTKEREKQADCMESYHCNTDKDLIAINPIDSTLLHLRGHREVVVPQTNLGIMCMTMMTSYHNHGTCFFIGEKSVVIISCQNVYCKMHLTLLFM